MKLGSGESLRSKGYLWRSRAVGAPLQLVVAAGHTAVHDHVVHLLRHSPHVHGSVDTSILTCCERYREPSFRGDVREVRGLQEKLGRSPRGLNMALRASEGQSTMGATPLSHTKRCDNASLCSGETKIWRCGGPEVMGGRGWYNDALVANTNIGTRVILCNEARNVHVYTTKSPCSPRFHLSRR